MIVKVIAQRLHQRDGYLIIMMMMMIVILIFMIVWMFARVVIRSYHTILIMMEII